MTSRIEWHSWHLHLDSSAQSLLDRVVSEVVGPAVRALDGAPWFFIRYWQGGPHLRLRVGDLSPRILDQTEELLRERLDSAGRTAPDEQPVSAERYEVEARLFAANERGSDRVVQSLRAPGVYRAVYEPETDRYGGAGLMPDTERLFQLSSELVLALLPHVSGPPARSLLALRATMSAAAALGGTAQQALYYANSLAAWRAWAIGLGRTQEEIDRLCAVPEGSRPADPTQHGPFAAWHAALVDLTETIRATSPVIPGQILVSHVHMFHNRIGRTLFDELRTYALLTAAFPAEAAPVPGGGR